jgi:hypothetical protein
MLREWKFKNTLRAWKIIKHVEGMEDYKACRGQGRL